MESLLPPRSISEALSYANIPQRGFTFEFYAMGYSNGGTLTLPSPTHVHHVDVTSAVKSLRRSLSRSPSKWALKRSPTLSPKSPLSPCPTSPKRSSSQPSVFTGAFNNPPHTPSPLTPFPPSAKLALRSSNRTKTTPARTSSRPSPMRALSHTSDNTTNATTNLTVNSAGGQENRRSTSPRERKSFEKASKMPFNPEGSGASAVNHALSRLGGDGANDCHSPSATSSPLKRSDAIMNLDQASLGSPVAKRRSLHGSASFGHDFNVFDHGPSATSHFEIHDDSNQEYELSTASITSDSNSSFSSMPRRSSSLRKSTLQQRHGEKTSWGRRHAAQMLAAQQLASNGPEMSTPIAPKNRPRLSLDQFMPPMARDSPFSSLGNLPNASMHMVPPHQPHPLSRTMTTSSSSSSIPDESPTHAPPHFGEHPRPKLDFSKSLPPGALRPYTFEGPSDNSNSFSTPQNYKSVKPLPAAFMSTGLISKVNRNPEEPQIPRGNSKGNVPDTPCKKHVNGFSTYPAPVTGSAIARARHVRHSFGTPSGPFGAKPVAPGTFGNGDSVFGSGFAITRRGSFLSVDGDEGADSPDGKSDSQNIADFEMPPTPTKQALVSSLPHQIHRTGSPSNHRNLPASMSAVGYGLNKRLSRTSSKLNLSASLDDLDGDESDGSMDMNDSPTTSTFRAFGPSMSSSITVPSFSQSRAARASHHSPTPLLPKSLTTPFLTPSRPGFTKMSHVAPASPLERIDFLERLSPRTPQDSMLPPDPSGLSISNPRDNQAAKLGVNRASMPPPATPTAGRDYFSNIGDRRMSTTPVSTFVASELDDSLTSRFEKAEIIGSGEFSLVYRVTKTAHTVAIPSFNFAGSASPLQGRSSTPVPDRVFAVKKSRHPYTGARDRQKKLQEVSVLKALGHSDHVVDLIDSWEARSHLYIQTEFCEEGSLDIFLLKTGRKGRLDDFRIWKIMLELSQVCQR